MQRKFSSKLTMLDKTLRNAVVANQVSEVRRLINANANIDARDFVNKRTALHWAAERGHIECVALLLKAQAKLYIKDVKGQKPIDLVPKDKPDIRILLTYNIGNSSRTGLEKALRRAAANNQLDDLEYLATKVKIDAQASTNKRTALHWAAERGHIKCVDLLLNEFGAHLNIRDINGNAALHLAVINGKIRCVELLIQAKAILDLQNQAGKTAAEYALEKPEIFTHNVLQLLTPPPELVEIEPQNQNVYRGRRGRRRGRGRVISEGRRNNLKTGLINTQPGRSAANIKALIDALCKAINKGQLRKVKKKLNGLLEAGVNINHPIEFKSEKVTLFSMSIKAIIRECSETRQDIAKYLLEKKADTNVKEEYGRTPLHLLAMYGHGVSDSLVKKMIECGADINARDSFQDGYTPAHWAIVSKQESLLDVLLRHNVNLELQAGRFTVRRMLEWYYPEKLKISSNQLAFAWAIFDVSPLTRLEKLRSFLKDGADPNGLIVWPSSLNKDIFYKRRKSTPLEAVVKLSKLIEATEAHEVIQSELCNNKTIEFNLLQKAEILLEYNADPKEIYAFPNQTLLDIAVLHNNNSMARLLLKYFDPHEFKSNVTSFMVAVSQRNLELVELFLKEESMDYSNKYWGLIELSLAEKKDDKRDKALLKLFIKKKLLRRPLSIFEISAQKGQLTTMQILLENKELLLQDNSSFKSQDGLEEFANWEKRLELILSFALYNAIVFKHDDIVEFCLKNGANPNYALTNKFEDDVMVISITQNVDRSTMLYSAICERSSKSVALLLRYGANPIIANKTTSLLLAYQYLQPDFLEAILNKWGGVDESLQGLDLLSWIVARYFILEEENQAEQYLADIKKMIKILITHNIALYIVHKVIIELQKVQNSLRQKMYKNGIMLMLEEVLESGKKAQQIQISQKNPANCEATIFYSSSQLQKFCGRNYVLNVLGIPQAELEKWQQENKQKSQHPSMLFDKIRVFKINKNISWFNDGLKASFPDVKKIENLPNNYIYLDPVMLEQIPEEFLQCIKDMRFRFDGKHIKTLGCNEHPSLTNTPIQVTANGVTYENLHLTHEIKIHGSKARIFLCKLSPHGCATLYLGIIYDQKGLHTPADVTRITTLLRQKMCSDSGFSIVLPESKQVPENAVSSW